jgi:hypothetical protein
MRRSWTGIVASIVLSACQTAPEPQPPSAELAPPADDVVLRTDAAQYAAGDSVRLTLENHTDAEIGHNLCFAGLQVERNDEWIESPVREDRVCTTILHLLSPHESASYGHRLPDELPPGRYRFQDRIELMGEPQRRAVYSNAFVVAER